MSNVSSDQAATGPVLMEGPRSRVEEGPSQNWWTVRILGCSSTSHRPKRVSKGRPARLMSSSGSSSIRPRVRKSE